jgi:hypothetical protein
MPIPTSVSLTISPPTRVVALVGALVLTGLAAVVLLVGRGALADDPASTSSRPLASTRSASTPSGTKAKVVRPKPVRVPSGFPPRIDHALQYSRVVVVSVAMPGAPVDAIVRREARAAAKAGHAGFVAVSALNERAVAGLVAKAGVLPDPAVVIVRRPGVVAATFSVTDAATIQQAVAQARR